MAGRPYGLKAQSTNRGPFGQLRQDLSALAPLPVPILRELRPGWFLRFDEAPAVRIGCTSPDGDMRIAVESGQGSANRAGRSFSPRTALDIPLLPVDLVQHFLPARTTKPGGGDLAQYDPEKPDPGEQENEPCGTQLTDPEGWAERLTGWAFMRK